MAQCAIDEQIIYNSTVQEILDAEDFLKDVNAGLESVARGELYDCEEAELMMKQFKSEYKFKREQK